MNKIEKLKYIKNCDDRWKLLFKFCDYILFTQENDPEQKVFGEYWAFVNFCQRNMYKFNIPKLRRFCNSENYNQVFEDLKNQIKNIEILKEINFADNYGMGFDADGRLIIKVYDKIGGEYVSYTDKILTKTT